MEWNHGVAKEELRPIPLQRRCLGSGPEWVDPVRRSQEKKKKRTTKPYKTKKRKNTERKKEKQEKQRHLARMAEAHGSAQNELDVYVEEITKAVSAIKVVSWEAIRQDRFTLTPPDR